MPQSRNDHSDHWNLDVGARLLEDKKIEALTLGPALAGHDLLARVKAAEVCTEVQSRRTAVRHQVGMVLQAKRTGAVIARPPRISAAHEADGQKLVQLGQGA